MHINVSARSSPTATQPTTAVLVHGFLMRAPVMWIFARLLAQYGISAICFDYRSRGKSTPDHAQDLVKFCNTHLGVCAPWRIVGHSLGGLIGLEALRIRDNRAQTTDRLVALGAPFSGSATGRTLSTYRVLRPLLTPQAASWILQPSETTTRKTPERTEVGIIAGTTELGIGTLLPMLALPSPNDGTVSVDETTLAGASRVLVPTTHTGLVLSARVAKLTAQFLHDGRFPAPSSLPITP